MVILLVTVVEMTGCVVSDWALACVTGKMTVATVHSALNEKKGAH